jgi:hypothetical protein
LTVVNLIAIMDTLISAMCLIGLSGVVMTNLQDDWSYFKACLGDSYTPVIYGAHEAIHPARVAEVMREVKGTAAADVIASLVRDVELRRQRELRLYAEYVRRNTAGEQPGEPLVLDNAMIEYANQPIADWPVARDLPLQGDSFEDGLNAGIQLCSLSLAAHLDKNP